MKKLALASAIAAAISNNVYAIVTSNITQINVEFIASPGIDVATDCGNVPTYGQQLGFPPVTGLQASGATSSNIYIGGNVCLSWNSSPFPLSMVLDFYLQGAEVGGSNPGTLFDQGRIDVYLNWGTTSGWYYYGYVDAATTNIDCLASVGAGVQWVPNPNTLPGYVAGNAACKIMPNILPHFEIFLTGTNTK